MQNDQQSGRTAINVFQYSATAVLLAYTDTEYIVYTAVYDMRHEDVNMLEAACCGLLNVEPSEPGTRNDAIKNGAAG